LFVKLAMDTRHDMVFRAKGPELGNEKGRPILDGDPVRFKPVPSDIFGNKGRLTEKAVLVSGLPETMPEDCYVVLQPIFSGEGCHAVRIETDTWFQFGYKGHYPRTLEDEYHQPGSASDICETG